MAGGNKKKKTKPAPNPARGFATTSVASKPRIDPAEADAAAQSTSKALEPAKGLASSSARSTLPQEATAKPNDSKQLSPEEFERQLEESELQLLVEKHSQKVKRDAQRQKSRLETDRRLLRGQAESVNSRKWLPQEIIDHVFNMIQAEGRFAASGLGSETSTSGKLLPEEDLTMKLWTLQQTLVSAGFSGQRVETVLNHILDISPQVALSNKESIWGLDEALDWFARECDAEELPPYDRPSKTGGKTNADTPAETPLPSGSTTPLLLGPDTNKKPVGRSRNGATLPTPRSASPRKLILTYDEDIEPEDLLPLYLESKTKVFELQRRLQDVSRAKSLTVGPSSSTGAPPPDDHEVAELTAKLDRIERDPLFERDSAERQWKSKKIILERDFATLKRQQRAEPAEKAGGASDAAADRDVTQEAERIAAEILAESSDDDDGLADLFASLPVQEADPDTGKTVTVMNGSDGSRVVIRDFGKWTGVSPMRVLEEACRAR